ncbi:S1 family peptidase [Phytomonospora endophytica]|uniref:Secreted trypsin-like serine protease n=1 Tax=Phytomonospora endophytica TaxID=714109 RepID=A0A841FE00_9ACTN|nr:serine protease [Phytomonospora endophytica]MBB6035491.1 secreted trypsin-like serine protease [Phytomonospora endophytica]GIG63756.1 trypsin [Phytomonospora endophytica]
MFASPHTLHRARPVRDLALYLLAAVAFLIAVSLESPAAQADPGPRSPRIVGGTLAPPGEFPWMVRLSMGCGGSLYRPELVLTAAHCVAGVEDPRSITATAGTVDPDDPEALTSTATAVHVAPGYDGMGRDWALVRLKTPMHGLPLLPLTSGTAADHGTFTVTGWGATEPDGPQSPMLRMATVDFVDDDTCAAAGGSYVDLVPEEELCAGVPEGGVDSCQGDSGGPLFRPDAEGTVVQVGIVSWGEGCAEKGKPGVYTQVSAFTEEIATAAADPTW